MYYVMQVVFLVISLNNNGICLYTILGCKHHHVIFARKQDFGYKVCLAYVKPDSPSIDSTN